ACLLQLQDRPHGVFLSMKGIYQNGGVYYYHHTSTSRIFDRRISRDAASILSASSSSLPISFRISESFFLHGEFCMVITEVLSQGVITLAGDAVGLVGIVAVMLSMSPRLALITFSVLPLMIFATWLFARQAQIAFRQTRARIAAVVGDLAENISGMRVIQAFAQEEASLEHFDGVNRANRDANIAAMTIKPEKIRYGSLERSNGKAPRPAL
ncbi:MAG: ABC transporter ATP-binding protein, partial [Chloroflexi bacterium]|nr:ABC transporter ATP-binding protein [Chloroflexota bacterium]